MPFLLSQNKKFFLITLTSLLLVFSVLMLAFGDSQAALKTKASTIHAPHIIP